MSIGPSNARPHPAIVSEAAAWFVEFRAGEVSNEEARERFMEWLRRSPEHIQAYLEVSGAWADLPTSAPAGKIDMAAWIARARHDADVVDLPQRAHHTCAASGKTRELPRPRRRNPAIAACGLIACIALGVVAFGYLEGLYVTGIGEQRTIQLVDGSTIELNARSRIRVSLTAHRRDVALIQGQALFRVAKNSQRPFIVHAGNAQVRAVGTEFDVYRKSAGTVVTVVEGRVAVYGSSTPEQSESPPVSPSEHRNAGAQRDGLAVRETPVFGGDNRSGAATIFVSAGEQLTVTLDAVTKPRRTDAANATAWAQKRLMFDETPLNEVAEEFNRYNARPLVIEDPQLQRLKISGIYSSIDPTSLLNFLRTQPAIRVIETEREVRIIKREAH